LIPVRNHSLSCVQIIAWMSLPSFAIMHIETGYRYFKDLLGFDQYQLWSFQAIQRFWVIQFLTQNFVELQRREWSNSNASLTIGDVVRRILQDYFGQLVVYVYFLKSPPSQSLLSLIVLQVMYPQGVECLYTCS
jgi:hypothetical protein